MMVVDHFGLHYAPNGVGLLVQGTGVQHALDVHYDFEVKAKPPRRTMICPHSIDLEQTTEIPPLDDPLFKLMMPAPRSSRGAVFLPDDPATKELVRELMRLSSPSTSSSMLPLWLYKAEAVVDMLHLTNLQPLVIFDYDPKAQTRLSKLVEVAVFSPRQLIVLVPPLVLATQRSRLETSLTLLDIKPLPLERIGASSLRQVMLSQRD